MKLAPSTVALLLAVCGAGTFGHPAASWAQPGGADAPAAEAATEDADAAEVATRPPPTSTTSTPCDRSTCACATSCSRRARAAAVATQLFSTKISLRLTWTSARFQGVSRAAIRLDGASVYDDTDGAIAGDDGVRFEGYVAPGRHRITYRVEAAGKDDDRFTTAAETTIVVEAVAGRDLVVAARAHDGGDISYAWQRDQRGSYRVGIDVDVASRARPEAAAQRSAAVPTRLPRRPDAVAALR
ncbi:MAG: hypothetical protein R2939_13305 [Kofleriaceae bacterium]